MTSPVETWKVGDIFVVDRLSPKNLIPVGKVIKIAGRGSLARVYYSKINSDEIWGDFDIESQSFEQNRIFRIEDDKKRAFDVIFNN